MLKIPILEDGIISLGETTLLLRVVRPYVNKGDAEADELMELLLQVRADGVIEPGESNRIAWLLHEITVERAKRRRVEQAAVQSARRLSGGGQALPYGG